MRQMPLPSLFCCVEKDTISSCVLEETVVFRVLCQICIAAVTNHHTLSSFKQHSFIILLFCRSEPSPGLTGLKSRCQQAAYSFMETLWENCLLPRAAGRIQVLAVVRLGEVHILAGGQQRASSR